MREIKTQDGKLTITVADSNSGNGLNIFIEPTDMPFEQRRLNWGVRALGGDPEAQYLLASSLIEPGNTSQNFDAGIMWLRKAAKAGHEEAQATIRGLVAARVIDPD